MGYDSITELIIHIQKTELYQRQLYARSAWQKNKPIKSMLYAIEYYLDFIIIIIFYFIK